MYRDNDGRWWIQDDISLKHGSTVLWCWGCHVTRSGRWIASWRWAQLLWDHQTYKTIKNQQPTDAVGKSTKVLGPPGRVHILCLPQWCCWSSIVTCLHCCRGGHSRGVISCNVEAFHHPRQLLRSSHVFMGRSAPTLPGGWFPMVLHGAWWGQRPPADPVTYSSIYADSMNGNCTLNVPAILASDLRIIKFLSLQLQSAEPCWMSKRNIFFYICMQCPFGWDPPWKGFEMWLSRVAIRPYRTKLTRRCIQFDWKCRNSKHCLLHVNFCEVVAQGCSRSLVGLWTNG